MCEIIKHKNKRFLYVPRHAWAWSLRTSGMLVQFWDAQGNLVRTEYTSKKERYYRIDGIKWVTREYWSNSGYLTLHVYLVDGEEPVHDTITSLQDCRAFPGDLGDYLAEKVLEGDIRG